MLNQRFHHSSVLVPGGLAPHTRRRRAGQSLVEFALALPILLLIVAAVLEVGNTLTNYNRVQLVAREGARFGAAGGSNGGVKQVVLQAAEQSLIIEPDRMAAWVIRPTISYSGGVWSWANATPSLPWGVPVECIYGDRCGDPDDPADDEPPPMPPAQILADVTETNPQTGAAALNGTQFVVVAVYYEAQTILNLPFFNIADNQGRVPTWAYEVLYQEIAQSSQVDVGCSSYALAIEKSLLDGLREGDLLPPIKTNVPEDPDRREGFGFLAWNLAHMGADDIAANCAGCSSMAFPGNSRDDVRGFIEYDDSYSNPDPNTWDTGMHRGDWVVASSAPDVSNASTHLANHRDTGRHIRVIVYEYEHDTANNIPLNPRYIGFNGGPEVWQYRIDGFAIVQVVDYTPGGGNCQPPFCDTIEFKFIRWDNSCGFDF